MNLCIYGWKDVGRHVCMHQWMDVGRTVWPYVCICMHTGT